MFLQYLLSGDSIKRVALEQLNFSEGVRTFSGYYDNVLGRSLIRVATPTGWGELERGITSRRQLLVSFSESDENHLNTTEAVVQAQPIWRNHTKRPISRLRPRRSGPCPRSYIVNKAALLGECSSSLYCAHINILAEKWRSDPVNHTTARKDPLIIYLEQSQIHVSLPIIK